MKPPRRVFFLLLAGSTVILSLVLFWRRAGDRRFSPEASDYAAPTLAPGSGPDVPAPSAIRAVVDPGNDARVRRVREMLNALEPVLPGEVENKAAVELLLWWAEIDPAGAITYADAHPGLHGRPGLASEVFATWLDAKSELAIEWARSLPRGELRSRVLPGVIESMAETQPLDALEMASELSGEDRRLALASLFGQWASADPAHAAREAQGLPTEEERNLALRQVIGKWADLDLAASIAWVKSLPAASDPGSLDIQVAPLEILLEKWTAQAPMDAARYLITLPDGARRIQMLSTAAGQWAEQNPRDAFAWAAGLPSAADRNVALRGVLNDVAQSDTTAAATLALTLPAGNDQQKSLEMIIDQWSARAPDSLMRWATAQVSNAAQPSALPAIVTAWAGADLTTLGDWLSALPAGSARDSACAALAQHLAPTQPDLAREWAASIADSTLRQKQVNELETANVRRRGL